MPGLKLWSLSTRRTFNNQILHIIKDEGAYSTMHTLLVHLQTAHGDQSPIIAGLLLQLDLLLEPRKMSVYREEAIDNLILCLQNSDSPSTQLAAADTLLTLQGRFSYSGKPLVRKFLLKRAGIDKHYRTTMRSGDDQETMVCSLIGYIYIYMCVCERFTYKRLLTCDGTQPPI
ncbi:hypothetical protein HanPI659440_Chr10g0398991 [Helianthus annuus]|nr:hypothetical protein HanPI659440_Chr10g0398991 [Helianthus annuus]